MNDTPQLLALMQKTRDMRAYDCVKEFETLAYKLEKENAALRGLLQDSLEWLDDYGMRMSGTSNLVSRIETALRKEAQS